MILVRSGLDFFPPVARQSSVGRNGQDMQSRPFLRPGGGRKGKFTISFFCFLGDLQPFFNNNEDAYVAPNVMDHLRAIYDDPNLLCCLKLELVAVVDVGKHFVSATYDLEGDSALSLCCYQRVRIQALCDACQLNVAQMHFPNLHSVSVSLSASYPEVTVDWAKT